MVFLHPTDMNRRPLCASIECKVNGNVGPYILELWTEAPRHHQSTKMALLTTMLDETNLNNKRASDRNYNAVKMHCIHNVQDGWKTLLGF